MYMEGGYDMDKAKKINSDFDKQIKRLIEKDVID